MNKKIIAAAVVLLAVGSTACSSKKSGGNGGDAGEPSAITVTAIDGADGTFSFSVEEEVTGGAVEFTLVNDGEAPHDFQLIEATEGHTIDELIAGFEDENAPFESWLQPEGGVGMAAAGTSRVATMDLAAGDYWYFCTQSSPVDGEDVGHAGAGMAGELTVAGDNDATLPATEVSFTTEEYSISGAGLAEGLNTVEFKNEGSLPHHVVYAPIADGKTLEDVTDFIAAGDDAQGPPPVDFEALSSLPVLKGGASLVTEVELEAGRSYVLLCFIPDPGTAGPPHAAKGMVGSIDVA